MTDPANVYETMRSAVDEVCGAAFCLDQLTRVAEGDDALTLEDLETSELTRIADAADITKFLWAKLNRLRIEADRLERLAGVIDLGELWQTLRTRIDAFGASTGSADTSTESAGVAAAE
jgi:hypothetical protein